jgi:capsular polysaccharide transport system ATP-binding protein
MIEFQRVSKAYRSAKASKVILANFNGALPRDHNIGLMGANGVGKSTLIRMIAGVEYPDKGSIRRNVRISFPLGLASCFKGNLSGRENCRFVARIYGLSTKRVEEFVEDFAEVGKYFEMPIATYSSGMRSRVSFAVSMAVNFDCYLVDEALSVGDAKFKARCEAIFAEKRRNASLILVSHSMGMLRQLCDMGAILADGRLRLYDKIDDGIKDYQAMNGTMDAAE